MATVQAWINRALGLIDHVPSAGTAGADDSTYCLDVLNAMIDAWAAEGTLIYKIIEETVATGGAASFTWGPSMTITSQVPTRIFAARMVIVTGLSLPIKIVLADEWAQITDFTAVGYSDKLFYDYGFPTGILQIWPQPSAGGSLRLYSYKQVLFGTVALAATLVLPPGYEQALVFNLAVKVAPHFRREISPSVAETAQMSKASLIMLNAQTIGLVSPPPPPPQRGN